MKKKIIIGCLLIVILFLTIVIFNNNNVKADSGYDSSWSSSDSDSSSSSDWGSSSSSDWGSSSSGSYGGGGGSFIATIYVMAVIVILIMIFNKNSNNSQTPITYGGELPINKIRELLGNDFDIGKFYQEAFKIYYDVQIAWMDNDIERVRNVLSDELYNSYKMQLLPMQVKNEKNMMEDIRLLNVYITNIEVRDKVQFITVFMNVSCRDYLINSKTNKVLKGNKSKVWNYLYRMTYMRATENTLDKCPNCGAKLDDSQSTICSYCHSVVTHKTEKFVLVNKKMIIQR